MALERGPPEVGDRGLLAGDLDDLALDRAPRGEVDDRGGDELAPAVAEGVDPHLDRDLGPVAATADRVRSIHLRREIHGPGPFPGAIRALARQDRADVGADERVRGVVEQLAEARVRVLDAAGLVDDDERVRGGLDDRAEPLLDAADDVLVGRGAPTSRAIVDAPTISPSGSEIGEIVSATRIARASRV